MMVAGDFTRKQWMIGIGSSVLAGLALWYFESKTSSASNNQAATIAAKQAAQDQQNQQQMLSILGSMQAPSSSANYAPTSSSTAQSSASVPTLSAADPTAGISSLLTQSSINTQIQSSLETALQSFQAPFAAAVGAVQSQVNNLSTPAVSVPLLPATDYTTNAVSPASEWSSLMYQPTLTAPSSTAPVYQASNGNAASNAVAPLITQNFSAGNNSSANTSTSPHLTASLPHTSMVAQGSYHG